jgi:hypothetical protein
VARKVKGNLVEVCRFVKETRRVEGDKLKKSAERFEKVPSSPNRSRDPGGGEIEMMRMAKEGPNGVDGSISRPINLRTKGRDIPVVDQLEITGSILIKKGV